MYNSSPISRGRSAGDEGWKGYMHIANAMRGSGLQLGMAPDVSGYIGGSRRQSITSSRRCDVCFAGSSREFQIRVPVVGAVQDAPDGIGEGKSGDAIQNLNMVSGARRPLKQSEGDYNAALVV
jgi:hypothetical protein